MKKLTSIFAGMALAVGITTVAFAADSAPVIAPIKSTVGLNFWMSNISNAAGIGEKVDQDFFPVLTGNVEVTPQISVLGEFGISGRKSPDKNTAISVKTDRLMIGGKYKLPASPINISFAYVDTKIKETDSNTSPALSGDIKISGVRLGVGAEKLFEGTPVTASIALAAGIKNKASNSINGGSGSTDATVTSLDLKLEYKIPNSPIKPVLGYRYENDKIKDFLNVAGSGWTQKIKGVFLGVEYSF